MYMYTHGLHNLTIPMICSLLYTDSLEFLLVCGVTPDEPAGVSGATALHYAVTGAHGQCVHSLLEYGASINAVVESEVSGSD